MKRRGLRSTGGKEHLVKRLSGALAAVLSSGKSLRRMCGIMGCKQCGWCDFFGLLKLMIK